MTDFPSGHNWLIIMRFSEDKWFSWCEENLMVSDLERSEMMREIEELRHETMVRLNSSQEELCLCDLLHERLGFACTMIPPMPASFNNDMIWG